MRFARTCALAVALTVAASSGFSQRIFFGQNMPDVTLDAKARADVIDALAQAITDNYAIPETADKIAKMLRKRQSAGEYSKLTSAKAFSDLLTKQMSEIAHDPHLRVNYTPSVIPPMPPPLPPGTQHKVGADERLAHQRQNSQFQKAEILAGNVGLLKVDGFLDAEVGGATVAGVMAFLGNTDALIIDLRDNHGGGPEMVQLLASYFFSGGDTHLGSLAYRKKGSSERDIRDLRTLPYVSGGRYLDKEVYILTSRGTFSAAEEFTYDLQALKRATVVGEVTGGGANPGTGFRLSDHFGAYIPRGQSINPVTKTNWENVGVQPDIKVSRQDALKTAHEAAIRHLISKTTDEQELKALKAVLGSIGGEQSSPPAVGSASPPSQAAPGQTTQPGWNPPKGLPSGGTFQQQVPSGQN